MYVRYTALLTCPIASVSANRTSTSRRQAKSPGRSRGSSGTSVREWIGGSGWATGPSVGCGRMPRPLFPPWLRRGFEAAVAAAIVAVASLAGDRLGPAGVAFPFPPGPTGALLLAPAVLGLGVLTAS